VLCETTAVLPSYFPATWQIGISVCQLQPRLAWPVSWFYRAASNPAADAAIQDMRREAMGAEVPMFAKGSAGAREAFAHLRRGGMLGMLVDQKLNEGLAVPFFGRRAMTTPALAQFAIHFRCPVTGASGAPRAGAVPRDLRTADGTAGYQRPYSGRVCADPGDG
jgi:hypothetical protein